MTALPIIILKKVFHRGAEQIMIQFDYNEDLISLTRSIEGARWSKRKKSWYVKNTPEHLKAIDAVYKSKASLRNDSSSRINKGETLKVGKRTRVLSIDNRSTLNQFVIYLRGKCYSKSTVGTYSSLMADFLEFIKDKPLNTLTKRDVERFSEDFLVPKNYAISTHRLFISAVKLFMKFYPETNIDSLQLERPKKSKILPIVLSAEEIIDLLRSTKNLKHRAILGLIYSAGLRIGELINLELHHINIDRRQLLVKSGKGRKDRYVVLSEGFLPLLSNYLVTYKPQHFFVEGQNGKKYTASSIRKFLQRSCNAAKIRKRVTPHTLRHSYATHLLEQGVGLRHIQELLGHARPETTMIYTHVAKKDLLDIKSPLDTILLSLTKKQKQDQNILLSRNIDY